MLELRAVDEGAVPASVPATSRLFVLPVAARRWVSTDNTTMARDFLAIPLSTVSSESAFSLSGRILSDNWSSMTPETLEALVCVKDWLYKLPGNEDCSQIVVD